VVELCSLTVCYGMSLSWPAGAEHQQNPDRDIGITAIAV